jgi:hypothetical protein
MEHVRIRGAARVVAALGVTAGLGLFGLAGAPAASADTPVGQLTLSITQLDMYGQPVGTTTVTLTCEPTGGDHPDAAAACADLIAADGDIYSIPPVSDSNCKAPSSVEFDASGTWNGEPVTYGAKSPSRCDLIAQTGGHVFNF